MTIVQAAREAKKLGISYGQFVAGRREEKHADMKLNRVKEASKRKCVYCGQPIFEAKTTRKYCSEECQMRAKQLREKARHEAR